MAIGTYECLVLHHPAGVQQGCKKCRKVLSSGTFLLGVQVKEEGKTYNYLVGMDPQPVCCGETKKHFRVFKTKEETEAEAKKVDQYLKEKGTTEGLQLMTWAFPHELN